MTPFEEPGNSSIFLLTEHSKNIVGNKGDFSEFFREQRNIDPPGGASSVFTIFFRCTVCSF